MTSTQPGTAVRSLVDWHRRSQATACRNALDASTALAERRRERVEVEEFMTGYLSRRAASELSA